MTDKEREAWKALLDVEQAAVDKIKDLLNPLPEPTILSASTKWPPKGMIIEVWQPTLKQWHLRYSSGDGLFSLYANGLGFTYGEWRYPPAPWHLAPEWAKQWVVWSTGDSGWSVGHDRGCIDINVLHVENRPEVDR